MAATGVGTMTVGQLVIQNPAARPMLACDHALAPLTVLAPDGCLVQRGGPAQGAMMNVYMNRFGEEVECVTTALFPGPKSWV